MTAGKLPWRVGTRVGRTLYDADGNLVGLLDTRELAERVVEAVNRMQGSATGVQQRDGTWKLEVDG